MSDDFYTAAVVEFSLSTTPNIATAEPKRMIETSLNEYLRLINEATESGADIVVFPEGSLNYNGIGTRKNLIKYAVELSESDLFNSTTFENICDYSKKSSVRIRAEVLKINNSFRVLDYLKNIIHGQEKQDLCVGECDRALRLWKAG